MSSYDLILQFWNLMNSNDFHSLSSVLHDSFILDWPQSKERIIGSANFASVNSEYPANGLWKFTINDIICHENKGVTDVSITDGVISARAISFFTIQDNKIIYIKEFWPDIYEAPSNRSHLVEKTE